MARSDSEIRGEHHADGMLGDCLAVAARLIEHEHAGSGASLHVDRVVAGAVGRDDQQVREADEEIGGGVKMRRNLIARGADLVGMGGGENRLDRSGRAVVLEPVEPDVRPLGDRIEIALVREVFDIERALGVDDHESDFHEVEVRRAVGFRDGRDTQQKRISPAGATVTRGAGRVGSI